MSFVREKPRHATTLSAANYEAEDLQKGPHLDSLGSRRSCLSIHQLGTGHQLRVPPGRAEVTKWLVAGESVSMARISAGYTNDGPRHETSEPVAERSDLFWLRIRSNWCGYECPACASG